MATEDLVSETLDDAAGDVVPLFSLALSEDQTDIRDWVHGFAIYTIFEGHLGDPAAHDLARDLRHEDRLSRDARLR